MCYNQSVCRNMKSEGKEEQYMIHVWAADAAVLMEPSKYEAYYHHVPRWRQEKADRICVFEDRVLSIAAWALYQRALMESGLSENMVFNLSHSGHHVLCSIADAPGIRNGCDLEKIGEPRLKVAKRFFCRSEWEYISGRNVGKEQTEAFYRYWVLKESFMKATRLGMKLPLNEFEICLREKGNPVLIRKPDEIEGRFFFREYPEQEKGFFAAVCSEDSDFVENLRWIEL